jgi:hypothetical protein
VTGNGHHETDGLPSALPVSAAVPLDLKAEDVQAPVKAPVLDPASAAAAAGVLTKSASGTKRNPGYKERSGNGDGGNGHGNGHGSDHGNGHGASHGNGHGVEVPAVTAEAIGPAAPGVVTVAMGPSPRDAYEELRQKRANSSDAKAMGFEGDPCPSCQQFQLVRNGTCLKCMSCGATTGCS